MAPLAPLKPAGTKDVPRLIVTTVRVLRREGQTQHPGSTAGGTPEIERHRHILPRFGATPSIERRKGERGIQKRELYARNR